MDATEQRIAELERQLAECEALRVAAACDELELVWAEMVDLRPATRGMTAVNAIQKITDFVRERIAELRGSTSPEATEPAAE